MKKDFIRAFRDDRIPAAAARLWDAEPEKLVWLASGRSFVYKASTKRGPDCVLRITHEGHRPTAQVVAELDYVTYLSDQGLRVIPPIPSRHGQLVEVLQTPLGRFSVACFGYVAGAGDAPWRHNPEEHQGVFRQLGHVMGRMHKLAKKYQPKGPRRLRWDEQQLVRHPLPARYLDEPGMREEHRSLLDWIRGQQEAPDRFGLVHADLPGNLVVADAGLQLFDFDNCCYHWYLYEFSGVLNFLRWASKSVRRRTLDVLLEGYAAEETLPPHAFEDINKFCRWGSLRRYVNHMRRRDNALVPPWQENQRQIEPFPISSHPPWFQNHLTGIQRQASGRFDWWGPGERDQVTP